LGAEESNDSNFFETVQKFFIKQLGNVFQYDKKNESLITVESARKAIQEC
jgi:hypothetical protein